MSRFENLSERAQDYRDRLGLRGQRAQLLVPSIIALLVVIVAALGLPGHSKVADRTSVAGKTATNGVSTIPGTSSATTNASGPSGSVSTSGLVPSGSVPGHTVPTGGAVATGGHSARGVTDKEILVGVAYDKSAGGLNAIYGAAGIGQVDQKTDQERIRDYINSHGGIGGRKIKLVWAEIDSLSGKSAQQIQQEVCTTWTQDNHVFAAFGGGDILDECLSKAGVVQAASGVGIFDSETLRKYPWSIHLGFPALDRMARLNVDQLHVAGFYAKGRSDQPKLPFKLGVVSYDEPVFDRALTAYKKALATYGITVSDVAQIKRAQAQADIANEISAERAAVLKFKSDHITHVNFLSTANGFEQVNFWENADVQHYYPRYGISSGDSAQALLPTIQQANGKAAIDRIFKESVGVGWIPLFDGPRSDYTGNAESPALRQCKQILNNETYDDASRNKEAIVASLCDTSFYFKAAVEKGGATVTQSSWLDGVANIGSPSSALTFVMATTAARHDGMGAIKDFKFYDDCTCFHYTSALKPV